MTLPAEVVAVTEALLTELDRRVPCGLDALYLHGSLAWGEHMPTSDVDAVAVWERLPGPADLPALREAHLAARSRVPRPVLDVLHCTAADLARDPAVVPDRPVFHLGRLHEAHRLDLSLVTWHELAERPVVVRGPRPRVHTDLPALLAATRDNLDTYWRDWLVRLERDDAARTGADDEQVVWVVLGAPRLHHLLATWRMTSKCGAGRYVLDRLHERFHPVAREALRLREDPTAGSTYGDPRHRHADVVALLRWVLDDALDDSLGAGPLP